MVSVIATLVGSLAVLLGMVTSISGWVVPWLRGQIVRPAVWGIGFALLGAEAVVFGVWRGAVESLLFNALRIAALVAGLLLLWLGSRSAVRPGAGES
ncbi:hypothetical protein ACWGKW_26890 [Streptomyces sp. NPDC054766]